MKKQMMTVGSLVAIIAGLSLAEGHAATTTAQPQHQVTSGQHRKATPRKHRKHHVRPTAHAHKAHAASTTVEVVAPAANSENIKAKKIEEKAPALLISGETSVNFYAFHGKQREQNGGKGRGTHMAVDDSRLNFEVLGSVPLLDYSFLIGLSGNTELSENPVQENRLKFTGRFGTVLAGDHRGVSDFMARGAFSICAAAATGGIYGNYKAVINETSGALLRDDLALSGALQSPKDMTKITYVTPRVYGFQVGYSFTPDGTHRGEGKLKSHTFADTGVFGANNIHELGVNWIKTFANGLSAALSFTGLTGKARNEQRMDNAKRDTALYPFKRHNPKAYAIGATLEYKGFAIGGEYLDNRKSGVLKAFQGANGGKMTTLGIGYEWGFNTVGLTYMHSKRKLGKQGGIDFGHVTSDVGALALERKFYTGLSGYVEGVAFRSKASNQGKLATWHKSKNGFKGDTILNNRGQVTTVGMKMKF